MTRMLTLLALTIAFAATSGFAQGTARKQGVNDSLFTAAAADSGAAEVALSELGVQKATDPELKKFSREMVEEHTKLNQELLGLAGQKRIAVPRVVDSRAQFCQQSLMGLSGEEFDRCYAKAQLVAHLEALAAYEAEAERGGDPEVRALAAKSVEHIKKHLKKIKAITMKYDKEEKGKAHGEE